jgi:hypothetical protein
VTRTDPGHVLRLALLVWGAGHLAVGRRTFGWSLVVTEVVAALLVAWLTVGLANSSAYLVPFLAGVAFLAAWAWQAVDAYRHARSAEAATGPVPERSPAVAAGWLAIPLLAWFAGFWLIGGDGSTAAAALDRFVTDWSDDALDGGRWPSSVRAAADEARDALRAGADDLRDVRFSLADVTDDGATAVAEAVHYERRESRFLWVFAGSELVPVADAEVLTLELEARPVELPGGGDVGAVRWVIVDARAG